LDWEGLARRHGRHVGWGLLRLGIDRLLIASTEM
jgi:hypothetical protein